MTPFPQVKAAILHTLGTLIQKAGAGLKPFVPQLQTTFLKCLSDPSDLVRRWERRRRLGRQRERHLWGGGWGEV